MQLGLLLAIAEGLRAHQLQVTDGRHIEGQRRLASLLPIFSPFQLIMTARAHRHAARYRPAGGGSGRSVRGPRSGLELAPFLLGGETALQILAGGIVAGIDRQQQAGSR